MAHDGHAWPAGLSERWGHSGPELLMVAIGGVIALEMRPSMSPVQTLGALGVVAFVLLTWAMMRRHDRGLCELCMAAMPLNPSELAARYRRRFWLSHTGTETRFVVPYLAVLLGSNFAPGPAGRVGWVLAQSSMIYLILSYSTHRRLQPWCPWCRDGGGADERHDTPDPVPGNGRRLV